MSDLEQNAAEEVETAPQVESENTEELANEVLEDDTNPAEMSEDSTFIPDDKMTPGIQKRINKLTWEKHEAERQAAARIQELEQTIAQMKQSAPVENAKPKLSDFDYDDEAYTDALVEWKLSQKTASQPQTQQAQQPNPEALAWAQKQSAYASEHADYVQMAAAMGNAVSSKAVESYIVNSEVGPKLHHHLLNNVSELIRIQQLPEWQQGAELVKLESKLSQVKKKQPSKAPEPVTQEHTRKAAQTKKPSSKMFPF